MKVSEERKVDSAPPVVDLKTQIAKLEAENIALSQELMEARKENEVLAKNAAEEI